MLQIQQLVQLLDQKLAVNQYRDYAPNGLQVAGRKSVQRIVTGVTACQALLDAAIEQQADAILVHHGYFWKGEDPVITGIKQRRIKTLLQHDLNLLAYHLPLDGHPELGNNVQIAQRLGINLYPRSNITDLCFGGEFAQALTIEQLLQRVQQHYQPNCLHLGDGPAQIKRIAWCSGAGQDYLQQAAEQGYDAFLTGEVSERTTHIAREYGIHFIAAGHHATECDGIRALGDWLAETQKLDVHFIDIANPV